MRIAIAGATGFIGSTLAEHLAGAGHEVTCLARGPERLRWLEGLPVRVVFGDIADPATLPPFVEGQEVIVNAAGLTRARTPEELSRVNTAGALNLLAAARGGAPRLSRYLYLSSVEAMGPNPDSTPLGEDAAQRPFTSYGRSKSDAERALRELRGSVPLTIIRPPGVYGPRDRDFLAYFRIAARGLQPVFGLRNMTNVVYVKNLVQGMRLAIERPVGSCRAYFFTDGEAIAQTAFADLIAAALGRRTLRIAVPTFVARAVAAVSGAAGAVTGKAPLLNSENIAKYGQEFWVVSDERARGELGYRPAYTTAEGLRETAAWYRENGWL
jgi:nucleoside-diphosphate-sugar epimerase